MTSLDCTINSENSIIIHCHYANVSFCVTLQYPFEVDEIR